VDETGQSYLSLEDLSESHELLPDSGTRSPFGGWKCFDNVDPRVFEALILSVAELHAGWWGQPGILEGVFASSSGGVETLIHNDFHLRNVVVPVEQGHPVIFDWENVCRGVGPTTSPTRLRVRC